MKNKATTFAALLMLLTMSTATAAQAGCDMLKESIEWDKSAQNTLRVSSLIIEDRAWELRGRPGMVELHKHISVVESMASQLSESARLVEEDVSRRNIPEFGAIWMKGKEPNRGDVTYFLSMLEMECKSIDTVASGQRLSHGQDNIKQTLNTIEHKSAALKKMLPALQRDCADPTKSCRDTLGKNNSAKKIYLLAAEMLVAESKLLAKTTDSGSSASTSSSNLNADTKARLWAIENSCNDIDKVLQDDRLPLTASPTMTKSWNSLKSTSAPLRADIANIKQDCADTCQISVRENIYRKAAAILEAVTKLQKEIFRLPY